MDETDLKLDGKHKRLSNFFYLVPSQGVLKKKDPKTPTSLIKTFQRELNNGPETNPFTTPEFLRLL